MGSPFDAPEVTQIYKNIMKGFSKVKFPEHMSNDLVDVIKSLCRKKPEERVAMQKGGVDSLKKMSFFNDFSWRQVEARQMEPPFRPDPVDLEKISQRRLERDFVVCPTEVKEWDGSLPRQDLEEMHEPDEVAHA